jgi:FlaG/FlaF family flagellin (archaellin)
MKTIILICALTLLLAAVTVSFVVGAVQAADASTGASTGHYLVERQAALEDRTCKLGCWG